MGDLIVLKARLQEQAGLGLERARPAFYLDLACPFSYLAAERVERLLGVVDWTPASGFPSSPDRVAEAEELAAALRLPLLWPEDYPTPVTGAMRALSYAAEAGASRRFALAAFRLRFCGGYQLARSEVLSELAAALGIPRAGCLEAAADERRDERLELTGRALRRKGVRELPAIQLEGRWLQGEQALLAAAALRHDVDAARHTRGAPHPLAPPA
jgi:2-hydroxychromene-2-carboxylate isomerase